jgi:hypothetical protein
LFLFATRPFRVSLCSTLQLIAEKQTSILIKVAIGSFQVPMMWGVFTMWSLFVVCGGRSEKLKRIVLFSREVCVVLGTRATSTCSSTSKNVYAC